jgi:hypothetical protein
VAGDAGHREEGRGHRRRHRGHGGERRTRRARGRGCGSDRRSPWVGCRSPTRPASRRTAACAP